MDLKIFSDDAPFFSGCNYWASHAGTFMWRNWNIDAVERDFKALSAHNVTVLRCFPLWTDFQPLTEHTKWAQLFEEFRLGEAPLPDDPVGQAGVDPVMLDRFHQFARMAEKYGLKLIVGLLTGWMSGRMYVPPAFERRNVLTDPEVIRWAVRFVRCFVRELKNEPAIVAWDWGNECNCMGEADNHQMWLWANTITSAIHAEDRSRPVVSGLHGSQLSYQADMGEAADVLCTHPYPCFTPHCNVDPIYAFRSVFHAAAETNFYSCIGKKPAFVEETGSYGPTFTSDANSAEFLRNSYWNSYAHSCHGALWWCANDQTELPQTPYDWVDMERELGLLRADGSAKLTLQEMAEFARISGANILPPHQVDAAVILTCGTDHWGMAYMSFLLAKQAGFDVDFAWCKNKLPKRKFYIMPSISGFGIMPKYRYLELLEEVKAGAVLLITSDGTGVQPMGPLGVVIESTWQNNTPGQVKSEELGIDLKISRKAQLELSAGSSQVLAYDEDDRPAFCINRYGKGKILFLNLPLERHLLDTPNAFAADAPDHSVIYRIAAAEAGIERLVSRQDREVTLTEHHFDSLKAAVVAVNNSRKGKEIALEISQGWQVERCVNGEYSCNTLKIPAKNGCIIYLKK